NLALEAHAFAGIRVLQAFLFHAAGVFYPNLLPLTRRPLHIEEAFAFGTVGCFSPVFRSEEHTSELQSLTNLVCRLLLENKTSAYDSFCLKNKMKKTTITRINRRAIKILRCRWRFRCLLNCGRSSGTNRLQNQYKRQKAP